MKVAIPTRNNVGDDHCGHCEYYTIFTISEDKLIVCTEIQASPEGCGCKSNIASVLEEKGVEFDTDLTAEDLKEFVAIYKE